VSSGEGDDFLVCAGDVNSHALELEVLYLGVEFQLVLIVLCLKLLAQTLELVIQDCELILSHCSDALPLRADSQFLPTQVVLFLVKPGD